LSPSTGLLITTASYLTFSFGKATLEHRSLTEYTKLPKRQQHNSNTPLFTNRLRQTKNTPNERTKSTSHPHTDINPQHASPRIMPAIKTIVRGINGVKNNLMVIAIIG
jgi:hypothetical protein